MNSVRQALGIALVLLVPLAAAGAPQLPQLPLLPSETQQAQAIADEAAQAAGLDYEHPGVPVVAAPLDDMGFDVPWVALAGSAAALAALVGAFFLGGARFVTAAEVLENDVRQRIYAYLKERVGANLKQVTDDLHLTTTNAIWHLRKLEEAGLIHSKRFNGYKVFYPADGGIEARKLSLGKTALANGNAQEVFEHVVAHPGTHQREIARALGVNHGTVRWHLKKLMSAELIVETRRGKASAYEPTPMGVSALRELTSQRAAATPASLVTAA